MTDDLASWELRIDACLGHANALLEYATEGTINSTATGRTIAACIQLAEAWRDLADAWADRQAREVELLAAEEALTTEEEPGDSPLESRRHRLGGLGRG